MSILSIFGKNTEGDSVAPWERPMSITLDFSMHVGGIDCSLEQLGDAIRRILEHAYAHYKAANTKDLKT